LTNPTLSAVLALSDVTRSVIDVGKHYGRDSGDKTEDPSSSHANWATPNDAGWNNCERKDDMNFVQQVATELLDFYGKGQLTVEEAKDKIDVLFIMGAHEARTALMGARLHKQLARRSALVVSGG
jgi:hypothetical protein